MDNKTWIVIDGCASRINPDDKRPITEDEHVAFLESLCEAAEKHGLGLGFGSFLATDKEIEERETNMERCDFKTGKIKAP